MKGSHTACDWLLKQLNQRFINIEAREQNSNLDIIEQKALEWNKTSKS